jgi:3-oxoacyl-[acyl-carrier-protein] synthase III
MLYLCVLYCYILSILTLNKHRSVDGARAEAESVIFKCVEDALAKTNTKPQDIDILIINCR